jgi:error-prone DNA polymerase
MSPANLVEEASRLGIDRLVLTDINNTAGCLDFVKLCREKGIVPLCGVECHQDDQYFYTFIAHDLEGFREINEFLSLHNLSGTPFPPVAPDFSSVHVFYRSNRLPGQALRENEHVAVAPWELTRLYGQRDLSPRVAMLPVSFASPADHELHRHARAIHHNIILSRLREDQLAHPGENMQNAARARMLYREYPQLVKQAENILDTCSFDFDFDTPKNKQSFSGSRYDDSLMLEQLALEGMVYRYGPRNKMALDRIQKELEVINRLGFCAYFLITRDIIRYSLSRGIPHVGRGSGGNSIVAYCLRITDIDPIELDLYFERFINPKRTSPPDFDIDYSWQDRDKIHAYIFAKHGKDHTALLGATNTFRDSSIIRELGKVYGLPKQDIDALVENPGNPLLQNDITAKIFLHGRQLMDFPHHRSIHAGGVLVSELPIYYYTALDLPPKGLPTTQWDMYVAEDIGFEKLDILSQRGLGHIHDAVQLVQQNKGIRVDIHRVDEFKRDPEVNQRLHEGEAIGCFYIESPAMRGLLKKLRCSDYISLVAASSIIRPGVAKSGMMREYIRRFHDPSRTRYLHPVFEQHLKETHGVMVYQEDVIKIAHHFAGLTLADADILRRAMSGKFRSKAEFERIRYTFFANCHERGYSQELAEEVWRQISSFAGYAFCKAHSASYAVESYQSLYLKTYHPHEFHVAVINNFGGFYQTWVYVNEARRHGATIHLPHLNKSQYLTCIEGNDIYLGWVHVKGLESKLAQAIVHEREQNGPYTGLSDLVARVTTTPEQVILLIKTGALRFEGKSKKELLWERLLHAPTATGPSPATLFAAGHPPLVLPPLDNDPLDNALDEMELLGFPVSMSRFDMLKTSYRGNANARDLLKHLNQTVRVVGDLVNIKYVHTVKKEWMHFGCFLDAHGYFLDTVHFPSSLKHYPFTGNGIYLIQGKVVEEFGFPSIEVEKMARLAFRTRE